VSEPGTALGAELDRQREVLVELDYPALTGMSLAELQKAVDALREPLQARVHGECRPQADRAPFILVVNRALAPVSQRVPLLSLASRRGNLSRHLADVDTFRPQVELPSAPVYALVDVERGDEFLGSRPAEAGPVIAARGRSLLTIEEGISYLHACPEALEKNKCFHLGASRTTDRRVPALWISERAPHLGWCWENNHHTWLGVASCAERLGPRGDVVGETRGTSPAAVQAT